MWSFALVAITIAIHAFGIVLIGAASKQIRVKLVRPGINDADSAAMTTVLIVAVGLSLAVLHSIESIIGRSFMCGLAHYHLRRMRHCIRSTL